MASQKGEGRGILTDNATLDVAPIAEAVHFEHSPTSPALQAYIAVYLVTPDLLVEVARHG